MRTVSVTGVTTDLEGLSEDLSCKAFNVVNVASDRTRTYIYMRDEETKDPTPVALAWIGRKGLGCSGAGWIACHKSATATPESAVLLPGYAGRLGNNLFQMATAISLAQTHGCGFLFPRWKYEGEFPLRRCFRQTIQPNRTYRQRRFRYDPIPYEKGIGLVGYYQSEKFFKPNESLVRELLTPYGTTADGPFSGSASLNVRRGDYLKQQHLFPVLPISYYEAAVDYLLTKHPVDRIVVLSDDLLWCRENFGKAPYEIVSDMGPAQQLAITISCRHHIMANSTFSWWGAWLDPHPDKIVIAPKTWFGPKVFHDTKDLLPPEWVVM